MKTLLALLFLITSSLSIAGTEEATYRVILTSLWSAKNHSGFPVNAHFSPPVLVSHDKSFSLYRAGEKASRPLEPLAELGQTRLIRNLIEHAQSEGAVLDHFEGENFFPNKVGASRSFEIKLDSEHSLLSLVTMIAPSPDWIVGFSSIPLFSQENGFVQTKEINLYAIDAGTEEGDRPGNFSINNRPTDPQKTIRALRKIQGFTKPFAKIFIEKI